ncbi:hypothetical protein M426DRAFT_58640 [Hypoxylon sp. CI-4A]|nr:hypothetical protein M426DRAFT_58640 [Hypoxylon sp. CI-4A]
MPGIVESEPPAEVNPPKIELPIDDTPPRPYVVFNQNVDIEIDFARKRVHGRSDILIVPVADVSEVYIDARQCEIDVKQITVSNCEVEASYQDPCDYAKTPENYRWSAPQWGIRKHRMAPLLHHRRKEVSALDHDFKCCTPLDGSIRVKLPSTEEVLQKNRNSSKSNQQDILLHQDGTVGGYRIRIPFKLKNVCDGLQFIGCDETDSRYPHVYTRHSIEPGTASAIFPCIDDPGSRNSWKLSVTCPRTLGDAFPQPLALHQQAKTVDGANGTGKRKHGEDEPKGAEISLTEEEKMLDMTVVCSGYFEGEVVHKDDDTKKTMTFTIARNKAAKHVGFAVGPFEHVDLWSEFRSEEDDTKLGVNAVKVHGYCLPGRADEVRHTCCTLVTAVDYFVLTFGRYPFDSYKVCFVDDMIEETIPLCAFSLCSTRLLYPEDIIDTEVETTRTLVYSLASQWFGVNIVPNTKGDIWLIVGIAWFLTDHFMKMLCGNNEYRFRMKTMADRLVQVDIKRPSLQDIGEHLYLGSFEVDFMNLKAPLVLFILDRRLSKSSSSTGISKIISRMVSKANTSGQASDEVLGSDAFRRACEKTGNTRLENFWAQWVAGSGCPRFNATQRFNKKRLCVEMTIKQEQAHAYNETRPLSKNEFWRYVVEEDHGVTPGEPQTYFLGPMTIRIHEADGTPYEHIVEIREDANGSCKFEIPYNTKYKRLKRNRRQRERALASSTKVDDEAHRELYLLGDVLMQADEVEDWNLHEWDEDLEAKMDQESYEWIRMDADFEWICSMATNLQSYMYASQLQQDRDVVAQQDGLLFIRGSIARFGYHGLVPTILTRTVMDPRYYYGLRVLAINELPRSACKELNWLGLKHLLKIFENLFCIPGTGQPRPNDFSDKRQYLVQRAIPGALARVRLEDGICPEEARRFLLRLLQNNDNSINIYSDQLYICELIKALGTSLIPDEKKRQQQKSMSFSFDKDDEDADGDQEMRDPVEIELEDFRVSAIEEIERYRRMDEYSPSYQNCFTVAALDALCRLMKAKVTLQDPAVFTQYLQDKTYDLVRIKAYESLIELGMLARPRFLKYAILLLSTDESPFVREQYFNAFCRGLASIAIGENEESEKALANEEPQDGLIVQKDDEIMNARKKSKARKEDLSVARKALKEATTDDQNLQASIWQAIDSPVLTIAERINLLELCSLLVEEEDSLIMAFKYPTFWTVERGEKGRHKCVMRFKRNYRTKSRKNYAVPPAPPKPEPIKDTSKPVKDTPKPVKDVQKSSKDIQKSTGKPPEPSFKPAKQSITAATPRAATPSVPQKKPKPGETQKDSISVQAPMRKPLPSAGSSSASNPAPSKPSHQPSPSTPSTQTPAPKGPQTKFKIRLKQPGSGSSSKE